VLTTLWRVAAGGVRLADELHRLRTSRGLRLVTATPAALPPLAHANNGASRDNSGRPGFPAAGSGLSPVRGPARGWRVADPALRPYRSPLLSGFQLGGYERGGFTEVTRRQRSPRPQPPPGRGGRNQHHRAFAAGRAPGRRAERAGHRVVRARMAS